MKYRVFDCDFAGRFQKKPVWACTCEVTKTRDKLRVSKKPVKGVIEGYKFIPYGKAGNLMRSHAVEPYSRVFADTYEECVELYNEMIDQNIQDLRYEIEIRSQLIKQLEKQRI